MKELCFHCCDGVFEHHTLLEVMGTTAAIQPPEQMLALCISANQRYLQCQHVFGNRVDSTRDVRQNKTDGLNIFPAVFLWRITLSLSFHANSFWKKLKKSASWFTLILFRVFVDTFRSDLRAWKSARTSHKWTWCVCTAGASCVRDCTEVACPLCVSGEAAGGFSLQGWTVVQRRAESLQESVWRLHLLIDLINTPSSRNHLQRCKPAEVAAGNRNLQTVEPQTRSHTITQYMIIHDPRWFDWSKAGYEDKVEKNSLHFIVIFERWCDGLHCSSTHLCPES